MKSVQIVKMFNAWQLNNINNFKYKPFILDIYRGEGFVFFGFEGLISSLVCRISASGDVTFLLTLGKKRKKGWPISSSMELSASHDAKGHYCPRSDSKVRYKTIDLLWENEVFSFILDIVNNISETTCICVRGKANLNNDPFDNHALFIENELALTHPYFDKFCKVSRVDCSVNNQNDGLMPVFKMCKFINTVTAPSYFHPKEHFVGFIKKLRYSEGIDSLWIIPKNIGGDICPCEPFLRAGRCRQVAISICNNPEIVSGMDHLKSIVNLEKIKSFIIKNKTTLLDFWNLEPESENYADVSFLADRLVSIE